PTDSLLLANNNIAEMDSASIDTLFNQNYKERFKFNRDQKLYMLAMDPYFEYEDPDNPEVDEEPPATLEEDEVVEEKKKKSWWPFGRKNRNKDEDPDLNSPDTKNEEGADNDEEDK
ncbi:MAG: hypothetical protein ACOC4B_03210, partial [Bacteroidota bacterium]